LSASALQRVAAGDGAAVREVLDRYAGLVLSLARRFAPGDADAEDAVQEIFVDIWRSAGRFDPSVASEATFVAMIARRRLIDRRRRDVRQRDTAPIDERNPPVADWGAETSAGGEEARLALKALGELRPDQQEVIRLSVLHGVSHERIAEATGLPLGTVKTHARRGLLRLREMLDQGRRGRPMGVAL
jgi:RNA polymerase sigma-70 factor (ECF subfamily)